MALGPVENFVGLCTHLDAWIHYISNVMHFIFLIIQFLNVKCFQF